MRNDFAVREAKPEEHAEVGALMVAVYAALEGFPSPEEQPAYYAMLRNVGELAKTPSRTILVAAEDDALLGAVVYIAEMADYGAGGAASRERNASGFRLLATSPSARGRGVGKALALACVDEARRRGHAHVVLHTTRAMTIAWRMYERLGFVRAPDLDFDQAGLPVFGFRLALAGGTSAKR